MNERSGKYEQQITGYKAFIPQNLPPHPPVKIEKDLKKSLISNSVEFA